MITFYIPKYTKNFPNHMNTSWYILPTTDTVNLSSAIMKIEHSTADKEVAMFNIVIPNKATTYYVYAIRHMSDGSQMELPVTPITYNQNDIVIPVLFDAAVEDPTFKVINTLSLVNNTGYIEIETSAIRTAENGHKATHYVVKNSRMKIIYEDISSTDLTKKRINISDMTGYVTNEKLYVFVAHENNLGTVSNFTEHVINGVVDGPALAGHPHFIDPTQDYTPKFTSVLHTIKRLELVLDGKVIFTDKSSPFTIDRNRMQFNKNYLLRLYTEKDKITNIFIYSISTLPAREVYDINSSFVYKESFSLLPVTYTPKAKYIDGLIGSQYLDLINDDIYVFREPDFSTEPGKVAVQLTPSNDGSGPVNTMMFDSTRFGLDYFNAGHRRLGVFSAEGSIFSATRITNTSMGHYVTNKLTYAFDTDDVYGITVSGGKAWLASTDIMTGTVTSLVEIPDAPHPEKISVVFIGEEKVMVFGDIEAAYIYDIKGKTLDLVQHIEAEWRTKDWVGFLRYDGRPIFFAIDGTMAVVYHKDTDTFSVHGVGSATPIENIVHSRNGDFFLTNVPYQDPQPTVALADRMLQYT